MSDSIQIPDSVRRAALNLKEKNPWQGTVEERKVKFQTFVNQASEEFTESPTSPIGLLGAPTVVFENVTVPAPPGSSGSSYYKGSDHSIRIRNKASVITLLWCFAHAASISPSTVFALTVFEEFWPDQFARLDFSSGLAIAPPIE